MADSVSPPINFKTELQNLTIWTALLTPTVPTLVQDGVSALPNSKGGMTMLGAFQVEIETMLRH
jgi:hypothetical protein